MWGLGLGQKGLLRQMLRVDRKRVAVSLLAAICSYHYKHYFVQYYFIQYICVYNYMS